MQSRVTGWTVVPRILRKLRPRYAVRCIVALTLGMTLAGCGGSSGTFSTTKQPVATPAQTQPPVDPGTHVFAADYTAEITRDQLALTAYCVQGKGTAKAFAHALASLLDVYATWPEGVYRPAGQRPRALRADLRRVARVLRTCEMGWAAREIDKALAAQA